MQQAAAFFSRTVLHHYDAIFTRDYDVTAIAQEMTAWVDGKLTMAASDSKFWQIVMENEKEQ